MKTLKLASVPNSRPYSKRDFLGSRRGDADLLIPVDKSCRDSLQDAIRYASEAVDGRLGPIDAARKIASGLGDCYTFLQQDIDVVDQLAGIAGLIDEYDEISHEPDKAKEIESEIGEAIRHFVRLGSMVGLNTASGHEHPDD